MVPRDVLDSPAYAAVRGNLDALGAWLLLYLEADALWPVAPSVPRWVSDDALDLLKAADLLSLQGEHHYRLAIVDHSRQQAREKARHAAVERWATKPEGGTE